MLLIHRARSASPECTSFHPVPWHSQSDPWYPLRTFRLSLLPLPCHPQFDPLYPPCFFSLYANPPFATPFVIYPLCTFSKYVISPFAVSFDLTYRICFVSSSCMSFLPLSCHSRSELQAVRPFSLCHTICDLTYRTRSAPSRCKFTLPISHPIFVFPRQISL
jgi:hypothetical protein